MVIKNKITVRAKSPIAQMVSLSAIGSSNAALNRRMNTAASVLINGAANTDSSTITVATPNAFLTISVQPTRVSIVSENIPPTTGTKLSTAYFAARIATPSMDALVTPCKDIAPRNTVKLIPSSQQTAPRSS